MTNPRLNHRCVLRIFPIILLLILLSATLSYADSDGIISGNVTDAVDTVLPSARVYLYSSTMRLSKIASTDISGNYTFTALASGTYYIRFSKTGIVPVWYNGASTQLSATPITVTAPNTVAGINGKLGVGGSISGKVTNAADAVLPNVNVYLFDSTGYPIVNTSTDPAGNYTISGLASGTYNVQFNNNGMIPVWYNGATTQQAATPIAVTAPDAVTGINGKLGVGSSVSGKVTDAADAALASVSVSIYDSTGYPLANTSTDAAGNYTISGLASGTYNIQFNNYVMVPVWYNGASTRQTATPITVTAPNALIGIDAKLGVGGSISGKVTDAADAALALVSVSVYDSTGNYIANTSTDAAGNYTISGFASGTYNIQFTKSGMIPNWYNGASTQQAATPITVTTPNAVNGINAKLSLGGTISGKVTNVDGAALPWVSVSLYDSTGYPINYTFTDSVGNYTFIGLASGTYNIQFSNSGMVPVWYNGATTWQNATSIPVTAPNAVTGINAKLGVGSSISGKVTDASDAALPWVSVSLYDSTGYPIVNTSTDAAGNYTISGLASGTYYIQFNNYVMAPVWYNGSTTRQNAIAIVVTAPNAVTGINAKLGVGSSISGKVTDASDAALPSVSVFLFDSTGYYIINTSTDAAGNYTISGLSSGTYFIQFSKNGMLPVWFNGATTQQAATPVTVTAPNVTSGVNGKIVTPLFVTINCLVNGTGGGTITSSPVGISCMNGKIDGCSAVFDSTLPATLNVTPNATSTFLGWSGDCVGLESCILNTPTNHNVTATFIAAPKAKIGDNSYTSLDAAYSAVATVAEIHTLDTELIEDLTIDDKIITLKGGYKADYSDLSGTPTVLNGVVKIRSGKLSVSNIVIR